MYDDDATSAQPIEPSYQLAGERTILANERTYSGWIRTALACEGVGLGFRAVLHDAHPAWLPKLVAAGFILTGIVLILSAHRRASHILTKLQADQEQLLPTAHLGWVTTALVTASCGVGIVMWCVALKNRNR